MRKNALDTLDFRGIKCGFTVFLSFLFLEMFLADAAGRTGPVIGDIFEWGAWGYACVGIAGFRIIDPSAYYTDIS